MRDAQYATLNDFEKVLTRLNAPGVFSYTYRVTEKYVILRCADCELFQVWYQCKDKRKAGRKLGLPYPKYRKQTIKHSRDSIADELKTIQLNL